MRSVPLSLRLLSIGLILYCATACGGSHEWYSPNPPDFASPRVIDGGDFSQCVPFARVESGIEIFGDASSWWNLASDKYRRASRPVAGSVLVLEGYSNAKRGHVAVVRRVVSSREIVIDHANWLNRGEVGLDQPVVDVSQENDWSAVRVWWSPIGQYGTRVYRAQGFILPANTPVASIQNDPHTDDQVCRKS